MITTCPYLQKGDLIGIVCPAGYMEMDRVTECIRVLTEEWGYRVKPGTTVGGNSDNYFSGTDDERLADLQRMLDDDEVKAVLFARGGYGVGRIIDRIDFRRFVKRPKWLIGYSDITVLHAHLYSNYGISSIHSPMAGAFNDLGYLNRFVQSLHSALKGDMAAYTCEAHPYNREGEAIGEVVGGNLALLTHIIGTGSDLKTKDRILFIEDIGEYIYSADRMMWQLKRAGKLKKLAGLIIGGFTDMKDTTRPFGQGIFECIRDLVAEYDYPVCYNFPISHGKENYAVKIGVGYKLVVEKKGVLLEE